MSENKNKDSAKDDKAKPHKPYKVDGLQNWAAQGQVSGALRLAKAVGEAELAISPVGIRVTAAVALGLATSHLFESELTRDDKGGELPAFVALRKLIDSLQKIQTELETRSPNLDFLKALEGMDLVNEVHIIQSFQLPGFSNIEYTLCAHLGSEKSFHLPFLWDRDKDQFLVGIVYATKGKGDILPVLTHPLGSKVVADVVTLFPDLINIQTLDIKKITDIHGKQTFGVNSGETGFGGWGGDDDDDGDDGPLLN